MEGPSNASAADEGAPGEWTLLTVDGFAGAIGGTGKIFGTAGFQDVYVIDKPGTVDLDGSFNKGGDIVRLSGDASEWQVSRLGSVAIFSDGDTFVRIPAGATGTTIVFDDGPRTLWISTLEGAMKVGTQTVGVTLAEVTAFSDPSLLPTGQDATGTARLLLSPGAEVTAGGKLDIVGTSAGQELVHLLYGEASLDASFNQGGDTLKLDAPAADFLARQNGTGVFLNSDGVDAHVPAGIAGMTLEFAGGSQFQLAIDTDVGALFIGSQQIDATPMPLTFA